MRDFQAAQRRHISDGLPLEQLCAVRAVMGRRCRVALVTGQRCAAGWMLVVVLT